MIMTFDWIADAARNKSFKAVVESELDRKDIHEFTYRDIYRILFDSYAQMATIRPFANDSPWHNKIVLKMITYQLIREVINRNWDYFSESEIYDIE